MGQYQQWLHYRDAEQLLHTQLEELTEEFARLRTHEQLLQQMLSSVHPVQPQEEQLAQADETSLLQSHNEILHALTLGLNGHTHHRDFTPATNGNRTTEVAAHGTAELASTHANPVDEPEEAISPTFFARSSFSAAEEQTPPTSSQPSLDSNASLPPGPHIPYSESMLLPENMGASIEEHTQTEPRMELPWWLRNAALQNTSGPIDQETMRTNRLIQRWIERWGHHADVQELPEDSGGNGGDGEMGQNSADRRKDTSS